MRVLGCFCCLALLMAWPWKSNATPQSAPAQRLYGLWAEDCKAKLTKPMLLISHEYHAVINDISRGNWAGSLGRVARIEQKGRDVTVVFDLEMVPHGPEPRPTYRMVNANTLLHIRTREYWPNSVAVFVDGPDNPQPDHVYLSKDSYGTPYHRCRQDEAFVEAKMKQVLEENKDRAVKENGR